MFVNNKKSIFDKIDDKEIDINIETGQTARENEYVSEIMDIKNRNKYLQKDTGQIFMPKNLEQTFDQNIEYAKGCQQHGGIAVPGIIDGPDRHNKKLVVIDKTLTEAQVKAITDTLEGGDHELQQIFFCANQRKGKWAAKMLQQLTGGQMKTLTSFIYVEGNEFCDRLYK